MIEGFLLGVIVTSSLVAAGFFFKFWRRTADPLFFAFSAAFLIEGLNRLSFLFVDSSSEGSPMIYMVRLLAFLIIVMAIVAKNRSAPR